MERVYNEIVFRNNESPDLDATNMNAISHGLAVVDQRLVEHSRVFDADAETIKADVLDFVCDEVDFNGRGEIYGIDSLEGRTIKATNDVTVGNASLKAQKKPQTISCPML